MGANVDLQVDYQAGDGFKNMRQQESGFDVASQAPQSPSGSIRSW